MHASIGADAPSSQTASSRLSYVALVVLGTRVRHRRIAVSYASPHTNAQDAHASAAGESTH